MQQELEKLIKACKAGDRKAQYELYRRYSKAMYNTAFRITGNEAEAGDVLQEAFLDAFLQIDRFAGTATFGAWLKRIVVNKSIDQVRKRKAIHVDIEEGNGVMYQEDDIDTEVFWTMETLLEAIGKLPAGYRLVFNLYAIEGYDHEEISGILNISISGSKSQYHRAKQKLREILTEKSYV